MTHAHTKEGWGEHAEVHRCFDCDTPTSMCIGSYWLTSDDLWHLVVGDTGMALCPRCFERRSRAKGVYVYWRAETESP